MKSAGCRGTVTSIPHVEVECDVRLVEVRSTHIGWKQAEKRLPRLTGSKPNQDSREKIIKHLNTKRKESLHSVEVVWPSVA